MMNRVVAVVALLGVVSFANGASVRLPLERDGGRSRRLQLSSHEPGVDLTTDLISYYVPVSFGTPAQTSKLTLDTGSSDIGVRDAACPSCKATVGYNSEKSLTAKAIACGTTCPTGTCLDQKQCGVKEAFVDGTGFTAALYNDVVAIGAATAKVQFGKITNTTMSKTKGVDGIIGFAMPSISDTGNTWLSKWAEDVGDEFAPTFGLCLDDSGGSLVLGGDDDSLHGPLTMLNAFEAHGYWGVNITGVRITSSLLPNFSPEIAIQEQQSPADNIIDSGTANLKIGSSTFPEIEKAFAGMCGKLTDKSVWPGICDGKWNGQGYFQATKAQVESMPSLEFTIEGAGGVAGEQVVSVPATAWLDPFAGGFYINGLNPSFDETWILGDPFYRANYVLHDQVQRKIGVAAKDPKNLACKH